MNVLFSIKAVKKDENLESRTTEKCPWRSWTNESLKDKYKEMESFFSSRELLMIGYNSAFLYTFVNFLEENHIYL